MFRPKLLCQVFCVVLLGGASEACAQPRDLFVPLGRCSGTYRELLRHSGSSTAFREEFRDASIASPIVMPPFETLDEDGASATGFWDKLHQEQLKTDEPFRRVYAKMNAKQQVPFLGAYIERFGLEALEHEAVAKRLSMSDGQRVKLAKLIEFEQERARRLWDENKYVEIADKSEVPAMRHSWSLRLTAKLLTTEQREELERLRSVANKVQPTFTLGL